VTLPAGWYDDPAPGSHAWRWWDGAAWTPWTRIDPVPYLERHAFSARPRLGRGWFALATLVQLGLAVYLVVAVFGLVLGYRGYEELGIGAERPREMDRGTLAAVGDLAVPMEVAGVVLSAVIGVLFVAWLYRGHRSNSVAASRTEVRSGWAIGAWFVPFVNLVQPARVVLDLERCSRQPHDPSGSRLVMAWWVTFTVAWIGTRAVPEDADQDLPLKAYLGDLQDIVAWSLAFEALAVLAALLCIAVVRRITAQVRRSPYGPRHDEPVAAGAVSSGSSTSPVSAPRHALTPGPGRRPRSR
jgi:hypothetical protein